MSTLAPVASVDRDVATAIIDAAFAAIEQGAAVATHGFECWPDVCVVEAIANGEPIIDTAVINMGDGRRVLVYLQTEPTT